MFFHFLHVLLPFVDDDDDDDELCKACKEHIVWQKQRPHTSPSPSQESVT